MGTTVVDNVVLLVRASVNEVVLEALKAKSAAVIMVKIQDLQNAREQVEDAKAEVVMGQRLDTKKLAGLKDAIAECQTKAEDYARRGKDNLAKIQLATKKNKIAAQEKCQTALDEEAAELDKLDGALAVIDAKIDELSTAHDYVERALKIAKAENKTVQSLDDVTTVLQGQGVEKAVEWAEQVKTKADVKLDMALSRHSHLLNTDDPELDDELAQLKEKVGTQA